MTRLRLFVVALSLCLFGCGTPEVLVDRPPPAPKEERRGRKPPGDVFWKSGRWEWDAEAQHFYWVGGEWANPRPGRIWQNAYWEPAPGGKYRRVPERWDRVE